jgi:hypothetical protein
MSDAPMVMVADNTAVEDGTFGCYLRIRLIHERMRELVKRKTATREECEAAYEPVLNALKGLRDAEMEQDSEWIEFRRSCEQMEAWCAANGAPI